MVRRFPTRVFLIGLAIVLAAGAASWLYWANCCKLVTTENKHVGLEWSKTGPTAWRVEILSVEGASRLPNSQKFEARTWVPEGDSKFVVWRGPLRAEPGAAPPAEKGASIVSAAFVDDGDKMLGVGDSFVIEVCTGCSLRGVVFWVEEGPYLGAVELG